MLSELNLTFLFHGSIDSKPYGSKKDRMFYQSLCSVKKYFPNSTICLSTWYDQNYYPFKDMIDNIILSEDPGATIANKELKINSAINRHLYSTKRAITKINTEYVIVIRTDLLFEKNSIIDIYNKYNKNLNKNILRLNEKILVIADGTLNLKTHKYIHNYFYHFCDFLYLGRTKDILNLFFIPNELDSYKQKMYFEKNNKPIYSFDKKNNSYVQQYIPEAFLIVNFLKKNLNISGKKIQKSSYEFTNFDMKLNTLLISKYFILIDKNLLKIKWLKNNNMMKKEIDGVLGRYTIYLWRSHNSRYFSLYFILLHQIKVFKNIMFYFLKKGFLKIVH